MIYKGKWYIFGAGNKLALCYRDILKQRHELDRKDIYE